MKRQPHWVQPLLILGLWLGIAASPVRATDQRGEPAASIDLSSQAGLSAVQGQWRYADATLRVVAHHAPDAAGQPTGAPVQTWDIVPRAGAVDFDDSMWSILPPGTLSQRRGNGRVSFNWYRLQLTVPARIGDFDTRGATVEFTTSLDDYAEVWVDGELPRAAGQSGGSVIQGWNGVNHLVIGRNVQPGQKIQLAVFGINGPLSDPPPNFIWMRQATLSFRAGSRDDAEPRAVPPQEVNLAVTQLDPALEAIVPANPKLYKLAEGFQFTEGPVWVSTTQQLLLSDPNANRIYAYDSRTSTLSVFREPSGYDGADTAQYHQPGSNGLTLDEQGRLTIDQHGNRRILRLNADGSTTVLADRFRGRRLNSPNDLVYRSDGSLYFTDPPFGLPRVFDDPRKELPFSGVYRARNGHVTLLTRELKGPNGIAFSPDEKWLYVSNWDPARKVILRFPVSADGALGHSSVFADMTAELPGEEALDGMKVDKAGNVYVAAPDGLRIYAPDGRHLGTLVAPRAVHNIAWGDDGRTLYLCARDRLYRIALLSEGVRP
ncbi:MAG: SMP-30/gluconolactonase/LRE family protein [Steroidobacteraceae bacterium]